MEGVHWTVWNGCFMPSCCRGCGLGLPSFPVSPIYTPSWCPHPRLKWLVYDLMLRCCGVGLPWFPVSLIYTLPISLMMSLHSGFYDNFLYRYYRCTDCLLYRFALNIFPVRNSGSSWNVWEPAIGERGQLEVNDGKKTCPWLIGSRLSQMYMARFASCT